MHPSLPHNNTDFSLPHNNTDIESLNQNHTLEKALLRGGQGKGKKHHKTLL